MSEVAPGAMSLEESNDPPPPVETPAPAPEVAAAAVEPPANPEDAEPEGTIVNPGGEKLVPLSALAAARQKTREVNEQLAALKPKAELGEKAWQEWQAAQPLLERARQAANAPPPPPPKPAGPLTPDEALEYAKDLDLYKVDGTPDVDRAQRLATKQQLIAQKQAQQYVQPLIQHTAQGQSRTNLETAAAFKDANGHVVDRSILEGVWNSVPAEMSAQPQIAAVLYRQALAEMVLAGKYKGAVPPPPPPAPVHTESVGGANPPAQALTSIDHAFRSASDLSEKQFTAIAGKYQPGRTNSLE